MTKHVVHGYVRASTDQQTTEQQRLALEKAYPEDTTFAWYEENESGWTGRRNEYETLTTNIMRGRVKELAVWNIARLGRNQREALRLLQLCQDMRVKIRILDTDLDFSGPMGTALFAMFAAFAQMDSDTKSQNIKRKFQMKKKLDPDWKMHGNIKDTVSETVKKKAPEVYRMLDAGQSASYISSMLGLHEHTVGKLKRLRGKELLTRKEYAAKHPGWHLLPIEERPSI